MVRQLSCWASPIYTHPFCRHRDKVVEQGHLFQSILTFGGSCWPNGWWVGLVSGRSQVWIPASAGIVSGGSGIISSTLTTLNANCSVCIYVYVYWCVCVCPFGWVKCRAQIVSMGQHTLRLSLTFTWVYFVLPLCLLKKGEVITLL